MKCGGDYGNFRITGNFFDYIRNSEGYLFLKDKQIVKVEVFMDET